MKKMFAFMIATLLLVTGCNSQTSKVDDGKLHIVATYSIIADMVENITKDKAVVNSMVPIGSDPHSYEPLPSDSQNISDADLIFYNGFNLETGKGWFQNLLDTTNKNDVAFAVTENVEPIHLAEKGKETEIDPHAWLNVKNGIKYVELIADKIIAADPDNKAFYETNRDAYIKELKDLDTYIQDKVDAIPVEQRILVTSEGAFKYFSKAYGFDAQYIWEINTDNQGTPDQMKRVLDIINTKDVKALFLETSINPSTMETISTETGVPIHSKIFTDSLAAKGNDGDTYITMMQWNINHIAEGLTK
ncbi:manganese ABC transporter substrate-binding protein [Erysipelothrix larvae]|uniref:Manganese ABC transporter substrate-binding protein n=1 Tax=Erysipelothrix larvae TaxID=1514105 RepID=A0A0X8H0G7_9FIRM|nr:metal ABC transporter substrate-binding protein [Erysipelothrix larvae]AMC93791.1 manganese ABC transporter substrate-binding protein [Erysipelothrix larvae]